MCRRGGRKHEWLQNKYEALSIGREFRPVVSTDNFVTKFPHVGEERLFCVVLVLPRYLERIKTSF